MRLVLLIILFMSFFVYASASEVTGMLKTRTFVDSYDSSSIMDIAGDEKAMVEARIIARIMVEADITHDNILYVDYENSFSKGEYFSAMQALEEGTGYMDVVKSEEPKDKNQLFSLSQSYVDKNGGAAYHRLDRIYYKHVFTDGDIRFGRQAVYWGNGHILQIADFINPFSPKNIIRGHKEGRDMLFFRKAGRVFSEAQVLIAPGRATEDRDIEYDSSSVLLRLNRTGLENTFDIYTGAHNGDELAGTGGRFSFGNGGVSGDVLLVNGSEEVSLTAVLSSDYEWLTMGDRTAGFFELYYNSLGEASMGSAKDNPDLIKKLGNGDLKLRDEYYAATGITFVPYKKISLYIQVIMNLRDNSYLLEQKIQYNHTENLKFVVGGELPSGGIGTDFGGYYDKDAEGVVSTAKRVFCQVALYF